MGWRYTVTIPANCTVALCLPGKEAVTLESGTYSFCGESMEIEKILSQMTLEDKIALCSGANFWQTKKYEQYGIASLFMCDGPHGLRKQEDAADMLGVNKSRPATCFPAEVTTAGSWDPELLTEIGAAIGEEAKEQGGRPCSRPRCQPQAQPPLRA